jgi:hypothetical protein
MPYTHDSRTLLLVVVAATMAVGTKVADIAREQSAMDKEQVVVVLVALRECALPALLQVLPFALLQAMVWPLAMKRALLERSLLVPRHFAF